MKTTKGMSIELRGLFYGDKDYTKQVIKLLTEWRRDLEEAAMIEQRWVCKNAVVDVWQDPKSLPLYHAVLDAILYADGEE